MELEIGMGRSHYLFERAAAVPATKIVGIEYKERWVKQALKKKERESIANALPIFGDARLLVPEMFPEGSLDNITLNFPDPWWKKKHHKRRIVRDKFLDILVSKLKIGGTIFFQTDVRMLFDEYMECFELHGALENKYGRHQQCPVNPMNARSHREKKCAENGIMVYRTLFSRVR